MKKITLLNEYLHKLAKSQDDLFELAEKLIYDLESSAEYSDIKMKISSKITSIYDIFCDKEVPLYAKQTVLNCLILCFIELRKSEFKKDFILFEAIKQLFEKIEFNYIFLNDETFKVALEFAQMHNLVDINGANIPTALGMKLVYLDNKKVADIFETTDDFYKKPGLFKKWLEGRPCPDSFKGINDKVKKDNIEDEKSNDNKDYLSAIDFSKKIKNNKRFIGLANAPIIIDDLNKTELCEDVVGKIIGFSGIENFGNKVYGDKFAKKAND